MTGPLTGALSVLVGGVHCEIPHFILSSMGTKMIYSSLWDYYIVFRRYPISGLGFLEIDPWNKYTEH